MIVCGVPHPQHRTTTCERAPDHSDTETWNGRRTDWHVGRDSEGVRRTWKPLHTWTPRTVHTEQLDQVAEDDVLALLAEAPAELQLVETPAPVQPQGTVARRAHLETELRQYARQLLQLPVGSLADGPTAFMDLEAALDYLMTLVQDGAR
jgi:hypothetical protein